MMIVRARIHDEFDIEDFATNNRTNKAPSAKFECFKWAVADQKPVFCKDTSDLCKGWYCIRDAYGKGLKTKHYKYCLDNDPAVFEKTLSDSNSVAGTSPPRSQAMSERVLLATRIAWRRRPYNFTLQHQ